jgi:hypothetical protein
MVDNDFTIEAHHETSIVVRTAGVFDAFGSTLAVTTVTEVVAIIPSSPSYAPSTAHAQPSCRSYSVLQDREYPFETVQG